MNSITKQDKDFLQYLNQLISEHDAAEFLHHSVKTLQGWRCKNIGPKFVRISGRSIRYRRRDLQEWVESKLTHTVNGNEE